jgi:Tripartite tricarboxylate transporter family receptor
MKLPRRNFLHLALGAAALPAVSRFAWAQAYPTRPVRIIVPFTPDIVARLMGQWLSEQLGQQFVIENRPGAGSNIATEAVVRAPSDGYTLQRDHAAEHVRVLPGRSLAAKESFHGSGPERRSDQRERGAAQDLTAVGRARLRRCCGSLLETALRSAYPLTDPRQFDIL